MNKQNAILIISCDKYSDLWTPFFYLIKKNWPDCPYQIYLGSNTIRFTKDKRVKTILSGRDIDWSTSFKKILKQIPQKNLLVWPDDAFIIEKVDNKKIRYCFDFLAKRGRKNIHCRPPPVGEHQKNGELLGELPKGIPYRVNLEGFWNKTYLQKILVEGESPWNFEIMGSYRTSYDDGFYTSNTALFGFLHMVEKGKLVRSCVTYCNRMNIPLNLKKRRVLSRIHEVYNALLRAYVDFIFEINWKVRLKIMNLLRKFLVSY